MHDRLKRAGLAGLCVLCGCATHAKAPAGFSAVPGQVARPLPTGGTTEHAPPIEVAIPSIGVRSGLERLGMDAAGVLSPPRDPARAGWFAAGVRPGDAGPAVIAGHVDSRTGPAVFARLATLRRGALITVTGTDHRTVRFAVDEVRTYAKTRFPTADVYGGTPDAQLRLITCGGAFDRARGHYLLNIVVYASLP